MNKDEFMVIAMILRKNKPTYHQGEWLDLIYSIADGLVEEYPRFNLAEFIDRVLN